MDRTQGQSEPVERSAVAPAPPAETSGASGAPAASGSPAGSVPGVPAPAPGPVARIVTLTAGDFTLTVNPVDGSEIEPRRPGTGGTAPAKRDAAGRSARDAAARPPALPGPAAPVLPLLAREEERARLVRLLSRGRSIRLTGPAGSGRTALLDAVAADCAGLAPDGVVRLSGYGHQQPGELLHALYAAVYEASRERPERTQLLTRVRDIGAIVLLDDLEMGGAPLDELLRATPECAYLLAATPDTRAPSDDSHLEEVFLGGLGRAECLELLETGIGRALTEEETAWAGDLRFASEGLPLRFVQAAALLRQRDERNLTASGDEDEEPGVFEERQRDAAFIPLPTLAEGAAPAELLASRVSESARAALRIACALGGELPHHAHLPALVGDTHADAAVAELLGCGLLTPVGSRYRLAAGVARQLEEAGFGDTADEEARTAARHYAWWTGHASVTPERVAAEADAVLAALAGADVVAAVLLARTAAPAFAASRHWEAWERVLRSGAEAARKAGEVAEQAYFHHELGVLALCEGRLDRARAELEASIGLRGALADKRGTVAGRRALALVTDREKAGVEVSPPLRLEAPVTAAPATPTPAVAPEAVTTVLPAATTPASPVTSASVTTPMAPVVPVIGRPAVAPTTLSDVFEDAFPLDAKPTPAAPSPSPARPSAAAARARAQAARRKPVLLAAAGALTVAVLGTVVALTMTGSDDPEVPAGGTGPAASSTPTPETGVAGTSGNDPAPDPGTTAPDAPASDTPERGVSPDPNQPSRTPTRRPQTSPGHTPPTSDPNPNPKPSSPGPDPTPPTPTPPSTPTPTPTPTPTASPAGSPSST
ncbi:ATP-binding protein [Streptomyces sp. NPDC056387]|uniref:ATP-binding protein n=1 Tax=Streptomyces sp. NPDC056387 TaxID=3345803 RepID=UPI0035DC9EB1